MKLLKISIAVFAALMLTACGEAGAYSAQAGKEGTKQIRNADSVKTEKETDPGSRNVRKKGAEKKNPSGKESGRNPEGAVTEKKSEARHSEEETRTDRSGGSKETGSSPVTSVGTDPGRNSPGAAEKKEDPSGAGPSKATDTHTHDWEAVTETIHHDAVTEQVWTVDRAAWDETVQKAVPVYEEVLICVASCRGCGATFASEDIDTALVNCHDHIVRVHDNACGYGTEQSYTEKRQTGTEYVNKTIHHQEEGHYETVVKQKAWDETVITGYRCTGCGSTKKN